MTSNQNLPSQQDKNCKHLPEYETKLQFVLSERAALEQGIQSPDTHRHPSKTTQLQERLGSHHTTKLRSI